MYADKVESLQRGQLNGALRGSYASDVTADGSDGRIYIRTRTTLFAFGKSERIRK